MTQAATRPEYVWVSPDSGAEIRLDLDVVEGILYECMRGIGAVPKRGAEVGGVLLGSAEQDGGVLRVRIEAFEAVPIEYKHGPSYLLSEADDQLFAETMTRVRSGESQAVGFFRANTRDEMVLTDEDTNLLDRYFPEPGAIVLMTRPYASKLSHAGFFLKHNGQFETGTPPANEFPFRRRELLEEIGQGDAESTEPRVPYRPFAMPEPVSALVAADAALALRPAPPLYIPAAPEPVSKKRTRWVWVPLSFIFLLVGVLLGFQAALSVRGTGPDPYDLNLNVTRSGDALMLRWNRSAPAIRAARRGAIFIEDGSFRKSRELLGDELQNGSVVYSPSGKQVRFRLDVFPKERDTVSETIDWKQ